MLEICNEYAAANHIYFNSMKTVCIKYGDPVMEYEKALLNGVYLSWTDNVRHLGNYMCSNNDDLLDYTRKKSIQHTVLMNLFKSYCCSFYGSILLHLSKQLYIRNFRFFMACL